MSHPHHGGHPPPYRPRRINMALVYVVGGIAAAVAIAIALALALSGKDSPSSPTHVEIRPVSVPNAPVGPPRPNPGDNAAALAEKVAAIVEQRATSEFDGLACTSEAASELRRELANVPAGSSATVDDVLETMSQAQAKITLTANGQEQVVTLEMKYVGSQWCASGV